MERCEHVDGCDMSIAAAENVCEECVESGDTWVHVRVCKVCGHTGCCDSSKNRHARAHWQETGHAVIGPAETGSAGGGWLWCYEHDAYVGRDGT